MDAGDDSTGGTRTRRTVVKALGTSAVGVGVTSAEVRGATWGSHRRETTQSRTTVGMAAMSRLADRGDAFVDVLKNEGGLPSGIDVELDADPLRGNTRQQYQQWFEAEQRFPTLLMMDHEWVPAFAAGGQLQRLDGLVPDAVTNRVRDDYFEGMVTTATGPDGTLYGLPLFVDLPTIQYRRDALRAAGYVDADFRRWATSSMTWQEFSTVIADGMDASGLEGSLWQGDEYTGLACCDFLEFTSSWGGSYFGDFDNLFGPIGERPVTVDEPQVVDALRMMRTFVYGDDDPVALSDFAAISPEEVLGYREESSREAFTNGRAVALRNWPYSIGINAASGNFGDELGVMPIPYQVTASESPYGPEIGGISAALGGWHVAINPNAPAEKRQAAAEVLTALHTRPVRLFLFDELGWIPPESNDLSLSAFEEVSPLGQYAETLRVVGENVVPRPATRLWTEQVRPIATEVSAALSQEKRPDTAMADLRERLEEVEQSVVTVTPTATPATSTGSEGTTAGSGDDQSSAGSASGGDTAGDASSDGDGQAGTSSGSAPGFGVVTALAGLGLTAWHRRRRG